MKKVKTMSIDGRFATDYDEGLKNLLEDGWRIEDKTIIDGRYIYFVLTKEVS